MNFTEGTLLVPSCSEVRLCCSTDGLRTELGAEESVVAAGALLFLIEVVNIKHKVEAYCVRM